MGARVGGVALVLTSAILLSSPALAQRGRSCDNRTILRDLNRAENRAADAKENYRVIQNESRKYRVDQCDASRGFLTLLRGIGNTETAGVQAIFRDLVELRSKSRQSSMNIFADLAVKLNRAENRAEDTVSSIELVRAQHARYKFAPIAGLRAVIHNTVTLGNTETVNAQKIFKAMVQMRNYQRIKMSQMFPHITRLNRAENRTEDTLSSVELVKTSVLANRTGILQGLRLITELTQDLGATETKEVQAQYRLIIWN